MIRGGLRARLVIDSVRFAIISTLDQLGWFEPTVYDTPPGIRRHRPFRYIARPVNWATAIEPNAIAISSQDVGDNDLAFGGEVEDRHEIYVDLFAQDDSVGWQVSYDIRDSLLGKNPELGTLGPQVDVYDFRQPTPSPFATVDVDLIRVDRTQGEAREWQRHWFMMRILVEDDYVDEVAIATRGRAAGQSTTPLRDWSAADLLNWQRFHEVETREP